MFIASSAVTAQMVQLKHQIEHDTNTAPYPITINTPSESSTEVAQVIINSISLGTRVLGLTWASTVALLCNVGLWAWAWVGSREEPEAVKFHPVPKVELPISGIGYKTSGETKD